MIDEFIKDLRKKQPLLGILATFLIVVLFIIDAADKFQSLNSLFPTYKKALWVLVFTAPLIFCFIVSKNDHFQFSRWQRMIARFFLISFLLIIYYLVWAQIIEWYPPILIGFPQFFNFIQVALVITWAIWLAIISKQDFFYAKRKTILLCELSENASKEVPKDRHITQTLNDGLQVALENEEIEIKYVEEVVLENTRAIQLGKNANAVAVLFGYYTKTTTNILLNIKFQVVIKPNYYHPIRIDQKVIHIDNLDNGQLQLFLIRDFSSLAEFLIGLFEYSNKDYVDASNHFNLALSKIGNTNEGAYYYSLGLDALHLYSGNCYFQLKQIVEAKSHFESALSINNRYAKALHNLGIVCFVEGDSDQAIKYFSDAINNDNKLYIAYRNRAFVSIDLGHYVDADKDLDFYISNNPKDRESLKLHAVCLTNLGQYDKAIKRYITYLKKKPNNAGILFDLSRVYYLDNEISKSEIILRFLSLYKPFTLKALGELGDHKYQKGRHDRALYYYTRAIKIDEHNPNLFFSRAKAYEKLKQVQNSIADYIKSIEICPTLVDANFNLANIYLNLGQYEYAVKYYSSAINQTNRIPGAFFNRGQANFKLGRILEAKEDFDKYVQLSEGISRVKGLLARAMTLLKNGDYTNAMQDFEESLNMTNDVNEIIMIKANLANVCYSYAYILNSDRSISGNLQLVVTYLKRSIELNPSLLFKAKNEVAFKDLLQGLSL